MVSFYYTNWVCDCSSHFPHHKVLNNLHSSIINVQHQNQEHSLHVGKDNLNSVSVEYFTVTSSNELNNEESGIFSREDNNDQSNQETDSDIEINHSAFDNRPFYSFVLGCQAFNLEWGWRWLCCDRDQYLVSVITKQFTLKSSKVFIITCSSLASLLFRGLATKHETVKCAIQSNQKWRPLGLRHVDVLKGKTRVLAVPP